MKAIIEAGSKQFLVAKGDTLNVEKLNEEKTVEFPALAIIDGAKSTFKKGLVKAKVVGQVRDDKVMSIRYKAKKRVNKKRGHRQNKTVIEITDIA